jgi:hypothetical protein
MNENSELEHESQPNQQGENFPNAEQQFLTPKDILGYAEEYIVVKHEKKKKNVLLNYSLSNNLEDIKIAIFNRTGLNLKIENAKWTLNNLIFLLVSNP